MEAYSAGRRGEVLAACDANEGTRAIAPPRTRSWTIVIGELGADTAASSASTASSSIVARKRERWTLRPACSPSAVSW